MSALDDSVPNANFWRECGQFYLLSIEGASVRPLSIAPFVEQPWTGMYNFLNSCFLNAAVASW